MTTTTIAMPNVATLLAPIRPLTGFHEMQRLMQLRRWRQSVATCTPAKMTDEDRRIYNASVRMPLPIEPQALTLLQQSAASGLTGTNSITWLQGPPGAGKTDLAREIAAQYTDPNSVGQPASPSTTNINYAHIPIAEIAGQGDQIAGLARSGCTWFGLNPGTTGNASTNILAQAMYNCDTQVLIIDDLQSIDHLQKDIDALRVLLNKVPAHVILISLSPDYVRKESVAGALIQGTGPAEQILARTTILRLAGSSHLSEADMRTAIIDALAQFKLRHKCRQARAIAQWFVDHRDEDGLTTLPLIFRILRGLAVTAVGSSETITLHDVLNTRIK